MVRSTQTPLLFLLTTTLPSSEFDKQLMMDNYGRSQYSSHRIHWVSTTMIGLYVLLCLTGVLANLTVIVVMLKHRVLDSITNIFVLALAFSDIFLCAFNMPLQAVYEITEITHFSTGTCRILFASFGLPIYVSCLTILLITVDRYRIILHPLLPRMSSRCAVGLLVVTIVFSFCNAIPVALFSRSNQPINTLNAYCVEMWPSTTWRLIYSFVIFVLQFFLPLLVTSILSYRIYQRLEDLRFRRKDIKRKKRTNKILLSIVTCFAICWSPWACYSLFCEFRMYFHQTTTISTSNETWEYGNSSLLETKTNFFLSFNFPNEHTKIVDLLLKILAMGSCSINPFLYGWLNDSIRSIMRRLGQALCMKKSGNPQLPCRNGEHKSRNENEHDLVAMIPRPNGDQKYRLHDKSAIKLKERFNGHILPLSPSPSLETNSQKSYSPTLECDGIFSVTKVVVASRPSASTPLLPIVRYSSSRKLELLEDDSAYLKLGSFSNHPNEDSRGSEIDDRESPNFFSESDDASGGSNSEDFCPTKSTLVPVALHNDGAFQLTSMQPRISWSLDKFSSKRKVSLV